MLTLSLRMETGIDLDSLRMVVIKKSNEHLRKSA